MNILVTGGNGFIGSHLLVNLLELNHNVLVIDDFSNSFKNVIKNIKKLTEKNLIFHEIDICNKSKLEYIFKKFQPQLVFHLACLKSVEESNDNPLKYYKKNVSGAINLLHIMENNNCKKIIFSSSATVYGNPIYTPLDEKHSCQPINVYGRTKYFVEQIIQDWVSQDKKRSSVILRYFNPLGAHKSALIGENPRDQPNNISPILIDVIKGKIKTFCVFGNDYDTPDGTCIRDFIHINDLVNGHIKALDFCVRNKGNIILNLGTGKGYSVMELIKIFEKVSGKKINFKLIKRRQGDVPICIANPRKANEILGWSAQLDIEQMCKDALSFSIKSS